MMPEEKHIDLVDPVSVAVVGSGYWGKNLVRIFNQLGALKLICDNNDATIERFRQEYPDVEVCLALSDVIRRPDIQAVVIATPAETHFDLAREALSAGKHVYVEKPLVLNEKDGETLISLAKEQNKVLMVGHLLQYHPKFVRLKELAANGDLGRINYIYSHRLNLGKIRREENILWSFAPHDISMILALSREEPESAIATGNNYLHRKIADVTTTHLEFPSGLQAHIFVSWLHPFKEQKLVVVGDRKMAVFDDTQPWRDKLLLFPHEIKWKNNIPIPAKADAQRVDAPEKEPLRNECQLFLDCISNGQQPFTDGSEGLRVLKVLKASQRSLDQGGRRIYLRPGSNQSDCSPDAIDLRIADALAERTIAHPRRRGPNVFVHESAVIDENVRIGRDSKIWHFSHILPGSRIGGGCTIGQNVSIGPDVPIGNGCKIQNNVSVYKGVQLEDNVFCGPSMVFTNVFNPRAEINRMHQVRKTLVRKGATIGANAVIICGIEIGRYSFVGAGAVVTRDVPPHGLVAGNPARITGWVCQCGERLSEAMECRSCGARYKMNNGVITRDLDSHNMAQIATPVV